MPTYQYQCTACQEGLEVVQKFTDDALTECPDCQGRLKKVFSAVGIVFKGSGFYRNDSRSTTTSSSPATAGKSDEKSEKKEKAEKKAEPKSGSSASSSSSSSSSSAATASSSKASAASAASAA